MKSEKEIREKLEEIRKHDFLNRKPENIEVNSYVALSQCKLMGMSDALRFVLDEPATETEYGKI